MEQTKSEVISPEGHAIGTKQKILATGGNRSGKSDLLMKTLVEFCEKRGIPLESLIDGSAVKADVEAASDIFKQFMPQRAPKKEYKCGLPGCTVMSTRDYCCADHCKEHRKIIKERKS